MCFLAGQFNTILLPFSAFYQTLPKIKPLTKRESGDEQVEGMREERWKLVPYGRRSAVLVQMAFYSQRSTA